MTERRGEESLLLELVRRIVGWAKPPSPGPRGRIRRIIHVYLCWNRRLLLDPWLRYSPAIKLLRSYFRNGWPRVLDVGSGSAGLAYFSKKEVIGVDRSFVPDDLARFRSLMQPIRASATNLPFRDSSFEAVISMDLIEHLPRSVRGQAIAEMIRTAQSLVIVGFPFGAKSRKYDEQALVEERKRGGAPDWREEHVAYQVPGDEIHQSITQLVLSNPGSTLKWFPQEGINGLRLRWKLQFLIAKASRMYGVVFFPLYWIHRRGRPRRAYRRIYVIALRPLGRLPE